MISNKRVELNVGGKIFVTTLETLKEAPFLFELAQRQVNRSESCESIDTIDSVDSVLIDKNPARFEILLDYMRNESCLAKIVNSPELEEIKKDAEYFKMTTLLEKLAIEEAHSAPFFIEDKVVWRDENFIHALSKMKVTMDGNSEAVPLCFRNPPHWLAKKEHKVCPFCKEGFEMVEEKKSIFEFPRGYTHHTGRIVKAYKDNCCYDVVFGNSSVEFHIPGSLLRLDVQSSSQNCSCTT